MHHPPTPYAPSKTIPETVSPELFDPKVLLEALQACRRQTIALAHTLSNDLLKSQAHPDFSPIGWHLGHIAYIESRYVGERLAKLPRCFSPQNQQWDTLFDAEGLPKAERQNLPKLETLLHYLETVRAQTLKHLEHLPYSALSQQATRLCHWLLQHESQHIETMIMVLAMQQIKGKATALRLPFVQTAISVDTDTAKQATDMVFVASGTFLQGCNTPEAIDNERPAQAVWVPSYWIDRTPVTYAQYQQFIAAGGYQTEKWWSPAGWQWQQKRQLSGPLYGWQKKSQHQPQPKDSRDYAVCGVSWYEADAYARFVGKRLPTESEWEKAIATTPSCQRSTGRVWEWTASWFDGYPGFQPFPYAGYSQTYFDNAHRVLKGSSWATPKWLHRPSFRNWYHPFRRELFSGFRCASDQ